MTNKGPLRSVPAPVSRIDTQTVREKIAGGKKFEPDGAAPPAAVCAACQGHGETKSGVIDKATGLGPSCWQQHRWSPVAEFQYQAKQPTQHNNGETK